MWVSDTQLRWRVARRNSWTRVAVLWCAGASILAPNCLADDAERLQKMGLDRVERYRTQFYRTGDRNSLLPELQQAERELKSSYSAFVAQGNFAAAASSEMGLARIESIRSVEDLSIGQGQGINMAAAQPIETHNKASAGLFAAARDLARKAGDEAKESEALAGMARINGLNLGNVNDGLDQATEAIRLATKAGNNDRLFDALALAAELELKRGRLAAATEFLDRAMAISAKVQKRLLVYFGYRDRADIYRNRLNVCNTEPRFAACYQAVQLARADLQSAFRIVQELGYQYLAQDTRREYGEFDSLQALVKNQEQFFNANAQHFSAKKPKDVLVTEHFSAGASPEISAQLNALLRQSPGFTTSPDPSAYFVQGQMRQLEGNTTAALAAFLKTIDLLERDRRRLHDDESRGTFLEDKIDFYYEPIKLLLDQHRLAEAFDLMERSRSRGMEDLLTSWPLAFRTTKERELFSQLEHQRAQIGAEQQKLFRFTASGAREKRAAEIEQTEAQINKLQSEHQLLTKRIASEAPRLGELAESRTISLEAAQRLARDGGYDLLYYLALPTELIVWHIGGDSAQAFCVFLPRNYLIDKVGKLRANLTDRAQNTGASFDERISRELFLFLIQPTLGTLKTHRLVIIPHEELNYIPFQALQDPASGKYLGEQFQVTYAPSVTVMAQLRESPEISKGKLLAIANPSIESARAEVKAIGGLYPGRSRVVADASVRKDEVLTWAPGYNLLHLSVHGKFEESDPLLSYLELNPSEDDTSRLTAAEMFGLSMPRGSMVVLSACETGRVAATHANEILGMERALLFAGASELVLSSWEVDAGSTALWMETFYREAQRNSPSEAARLALLAVKARPEYGHPYYWSPFLVTGK